MNMYWIDVIGNTSTAFITIAIILAIITCIVLVIFGMEILQRGSEGYGLIKDLQKMKRSIKYLIISTGFFILGSIFIPSYRVLMEIYGPGEIVEHLKHGDIEVSDESIEIFEQWAKNYGKENK